MPTLSMPLPSRQICRLCHQGSGGPQWQAAYQVPLLSHWRRRRLHRQPRRSSVCSFDSHTLAKGACGQLDSTPNGVVYVAPTKRKSGDSRRKINSRARQQDAAAKGRPSTAIPSMDAKRGFYTNMEDKDQTLAIDLKTQKTVADLVPWAKKVPTAWGSTPPLATFSWLVARSRNLSTLAVCRALEG